MGQKAGSELWRIEHLKVFFRTKECDIAAVNELSLTMYQGERLCLLGESGCGKSVFGTTLLKLLPENAQISGKAYYEGMDILTMPEKEFRSLRGTKIAVIPQGAGSSLDPTMRCGKQVEENLRLHTKDGRKERQKKVLALLQKLELPRLPKLAKDYPFALSGGMKQRILVASGTICRPQFLLVDEPTKGLDWGKRDKVIALLKKLVEEEQTSVLLITHDFDVADALADRIAVMYAGEIVEYGTREEILKRPAHPYTKGLLDSLPRNGFHAIEGFSPSLDQLPEGCRFHPRCPYAVKRCGQEHPQLLSTGGGQKVRCFYAEG